MRRAEIVTASPIEVSSSQPLCFGLTIKNALIIQFWE